MKISEAIREVGKPVQFYPSLAKVLGVCEAIFIGQLLYWKGKEDTPKRGIRKSSDEIENETSITYRKQKRIKPRLKKLGIIEYEYDRQNHDTYYKINEKTLDKHYQKHSTNRPMGHRTKRPMPQDTSSLGIGRKVRSSITESTTESTTEIGAHTPKKELSKKITVEDKTQLFIADVKELLKGVTIKKVQIKEIQKFVEYWTEPNKSCTKIKWELEKTWDLKRRIGRWMRNSIEWGDKLNNRSKGKNYDEE